MARRSRKSGFDDSVELIARLPWYVCLALAAVSWFGFHELSQIAIPKPGLGGLTPAAYAKQLAAKAATLPPGSNAACY